MNYTIRLAEQTDMPEVLRLIKELAAFENMPEAVEIDVDYLKTSGFGKVPDFNVFLAEGDNQILGMALFYNRFSTWKGKSIHLEDLIVSEAFRGKGIGKELYTKVLEHAVSLGIKRVSWEVLDWNTNAINFYESTGAKILPNWRLVHIEKETLKQFVNSQHK